MGAELFIDFEELAFKPVGVGGMHNVIHLACIKAHSEPQHWISTLLFEISIVLSKLTLIQC
jgi:hypothetical protein